jgi:ABC-type glycerol-3-phosphate transport system substrate-binding protein
MKDFMENAVQVYMQENPHITVNAVLQESDSLYPAFRAAAEAKEGPDIQFFWAAFTLEDACWATWLPSATTGAQSWRTSCRPAG